MRPPCELVQRDYLPVVRASLAKKLNDAGFSQSDIAGKMSLTQAAVSKYLKQPIESGSLVEEIDQLTTKLSDMMISGSPGQDILVREICLACMISRIGAGICDLHRDRVPVLGQLNCRICSDLLKHSSATFSTRATVLRDMDAAMEILSSINLILRVILHVVLIIGSIQRILAWCAHVCTQKDTAKRTHLVD